MEGSRRTRAIAWLKDRLLPGHDPVAEADAALWEQRIGHTRVERLLMRGDYPYYELEPVKPVATLAGFRHVHTPLRYRLAKVIWYWRNGRAEAFPRCCIAAFCWDTFRHRYPGLERGSVGEGESLRVPCQWCKP